MKKLWIRFKKWVYGLLVAVGIMSVPFVYAGTIGFSWNNPTENVDGTPFDAATEQLETRIYCNGDTSPTFVSPGAADALSVITAPGVYTCYATVVNLDGTESDASNTVTKTVIAARPMPPVLDP